MFVVRLAIRSFFEVESGEDCILTFLTDESDYNIQLLPPIKMPMPLIVVVSEVHYPLNLDGKFFRIGCGLWN